MHYHPAEEKDAKDTIDYIKKVAPNTKVELYAGDLRTEKANLDMVDAIKKWSNNELHILYVIVLTTRLNPCPCFLLC